MLTVLFGSETISYHYSCSCCWGRPFSKMFKPPSDGDEIWRDCSSRKYALIEFDGIGFWFDVKVSRWRHFTQKSAATWWVTWSVYRTPMQHFLISYFFVWEQRSDASDHWPPDRTIAEILNYVENNVRWGYWSEEGRGWYRSKERLWLPIGSP